LLIVSAVNVYNEADILDQLLTHLHDNGISFVVLDGGSRDGSIDIAREYYTKGLLAHEVVKRDFKRWDLDLEYSLQMAIACSPEWILRNDADEFFESAVLGERLCDAISKEDKAGFNIIQFDNFEFCLTEKDFNSDEPDIRKKLKYYTWSDDYRFKAWKYYQGATDKPSGGHYPSYPPDVKPKVSPRKFVMRHYRFTSPEVAIRKVFEEKLPRYPPENRARGWHWHYDHFKRDPTFFILDSSKLSKYEENGRWDLTKKHDWYPNWSYPRREQLFPD
jgi:glycosyltransferase involved in cell wall biosynthesis